MLNTFYRYLYLNFRHLNQLASENIDAKYLVKELDGCQQMSILNSAIKQMVNIKSDLAVMFFGRDPQTKKVYCMASTPANCITRGLQANEWVAQIMPILNGKGGGKKEVAQTTGSNADRLDDAIKLANEFAKLKLML